MTQPERPAERMTLSERLGLGRRELRGAFRGTRDRADPGTKVAVIGGGVAGACAACVLAERGVEVTLIEREQWLGGRIGAWTERMPSGESFQMTRAVPTVHRHYYNVRALLRRVDPELRSLKLLADYPILGPDGAVESFTNLPRTAPLNLLAFLRRTQLIRLSDLRAIDSESFRAMVTFDPVRSYGELDGKSAREWLDRLALPPRARTMLVRVFSRSLFNDEDVISAAEMISRLHFYFLGNPEGMQVDAPEEPSADVWWKPMERYLRRHGVEVRLGQPCTRIDRDRLGVITVHLAGGEAIHCEGAVLALCARGVRDVLTSSPDLMADSEFASSIEGLALAAPFMVVRLFLDRLANEERPAYAQVAGLGVLDSVALLERIEGESRRFSMRHGGSVVQLQAVGLGSTRTHEDVLAELEERLGELYPELAGASVVHRVWMHEQAQPGFAPGSHGRRPRVVTPYGNVALAGDYVKLPFPAALMELAAASGFLAANQLLDRWDVRGESVWSIPPRGFMASLPFALRGE